MIATSVKASGLLVVDGKLNGYDYENQAWVANGVYLDCNHPKAGTMLLTGEVFEGCSCYGRKHKGEACEVEVED
jgi:hypothetical protein